MLGRSLTGQLASESRLHTEQRLSSQAERPTARGRHCPCTRCVPASPLLSPPAGTRRHTPAVPHAAAPDAHPRAFRPRPGDPRSRAGAPGAHSSRLDPPVRGGQGAATHRRSEEEGSRGARGGAPGGSAGAERHPPDVELRPEIPGGDVVCRKGRRCRRGRRGRRGRTPAGRRMRRRRMAVGSVFAQAVGAATRQRE